MDKIYGKHSGLRHGARQLLARLRFAPDIAAPDHMLIVQSTGFTEEYKRIFYRDIRYVEVRKSQRQLWIAVSFRVLTTLDGLFCFIP